MNDDVLALDTMVMDFSPKTLNFKLRGEKKENSFRICLSVDEFYDYFFDDINSLKSIANYLKKCDQNETLILKHLIPIETNKVIKMMNISSHIVKFEGISNPESHHTLTFFSDKPNYNKRITLSHYDYLSLIDALRFFIYSFENTYGKQTEN